MSINIPLQNRSPPSSSYHSLEQERDHRRNSHTSEAQDSACMTDDNQMLPRHSISRQSFHDRLFTKTWALELLCWFLALISLLVIIIVIRVFDGQPLQNWRSGLTLNTLINVVSQIAQTAVFVPVASSISQLKWIWFRKGGKRAIGDIEPFDKASRGPIDSLRLILNHLTWYLVWLGALNTSLILLLGSFAQQSVTSSLQQRNDTLGKASMPIKTQYQSYTISQILPGPDDDVLNFNTIVPELQVAFTVGLQSPTDPSAVTGVCPSGNCTFEDYSSLAICSSAKDVTPTLVVICPREYLETELGCNYTVPDLQQAHTWRNDSFATTNKLGNTLWIGASRTKQDGFTSGPGTLVEFYVLYFPDINVLAEGSDANITASVVALKGSLDLCVKTYHTSVTNGITTTYVTSNQTNLNWDNVSSSQGNTAVTLISAKAADGEVYWMEENTRGYFNAFLEAAGFYGEYAGGVPQDPNLNTATSDAARAIADKLYAVAPNGVAGLEALKEALANLETSMSNALRSAPSSASNVTAAGIPSQMVVFISVNFRWLIVPILSVSLGLIFLLAVIFETWRNDAPIWKDGQLDALYAIGPETRAMLETLDDAGMKSEEVELEKGGQRGWGLRASRSREAEGRANGL